MTFKKGYTPHNKGKKGPSGKDHPMYGKKHSEKSIRKMSKSKKGQTHSEATKRKMKGRIPWNKGKKELAPYKFSIKNNDNFRTRKKF